MTGNEAARLLAPGGTLRAALNLGNAVLVRRGPAGPEGTAVALATELGRRLGLPVALLEYGSAAKVAAEALSDAWDVGFMAVDPARAAVAFTQPYVMIEGTYVVPDASPLRDGAEVDAPGLRVAAGEGSAYHLHLARTLRRASFALAPTEPEAAALFLRGGAEVLAGVREANLALMARTPGLRALPGRFMAIPQAVCIPAARAAALPWLCRAVAEMVADGLIARALAVSGQDPALVAPEAAEG